MKSKTSKTNFYILCGLPGSGKSTWARWYHSKHPKSIIVNRDLIRTMIHGRYYHDKKSEEVVKMIAKICASTLIKKKYNVIIDETNITIKKRKEWTDLAISYKTRPIILYFPEQVNNLKNRMKDPRGIGKDVWKDVISKMKDNFESPTNLETADAFMMIDFIGQKDMSVFHV
jgi:predicted kinase